MIVSLLKHNIFCNETVINFYPFLLASIWPSICRYISITVTSRVDRRKEMEIKFKYLMNRAELPFVQMTLEKTKMHLFPLQLWVNLLRKFQSNFFPNECVKIKHGGSADFDSKDPFEMPHRLCGWHNWMYTCFLK